MALMAPAAAAVSSPLPFGNDEALEVEQKVFNWIREVFFTLSLPPLSVYLRLSPSVSVFIFFLVASNLFLSKPKNQT